MPVIVTPDLAIHYRQAGHGPQTIILLHGNYASSRWWVPLLNRLPGDVRACAPDLRGCGGREGRTQAHRRVSRLTLNDLADDLAQLITALRLNDVILVGHSLGGVIAIEYALARQNALRGLVLVDTAPPEGLALAASLARPWAMPLSFGSPALMRQALRQVGLPRRGQWADDLVSDALGTDPNQYIAFSEALESWSVEDRLQGLRVPTLLIWGRNDRITAYRAGRRYLDLLPAAQMVVIAGAGHSPQVERPDEFAQALRDFVASLSRVAPPEPEPARRSSLRERLAARVTGFIRRASS